MKAVFDTNILIDYLNGIENSANEINRFKSKAISIITYIEVLVGLNNIDVNIVTNVKDFLDTFDLIMVNQKIADLSILARMEYKLKIPDAIIFATAQSIDALLITRNTKDFSPSSPIIRVPYSLV